MHGVNAAADSQLCVIPYDLLVIILSYVQSACFDDQNLDQLPRVMVHRDLLTCACVCSSWADTTRAIVYRNIKIPLARLELGLDTSIIAYSNWWAFAALQRTLSSFSTTSPHTLHSVQSLELDVQLYSEESTADINCVDNGGEGSSDCSDRDRDAINVADAQYCDYNGLAALLRLLPRLRSLTIFCHDSTHLRGNFPRKPVPSDLLSAFSSLAHLRRFRILQGLDTSVASTASRQLVFEVIAAQPYITHLDMRPALLVSGIQPRKTSLTNDPVLQYLAVTCQGTKGELAFLAPYCATLECLFLDINCWNGASLLDAAHLFPPSLRTLAISCLNTHILTFDGIIDPLLDALHGSTLLHTVIVQSDLHNVDRIISSMPASVTALGLSCRSITEMWATDALQRSIVEREPGLTSLSIYAHWARSTDERLTAEDQAEVEFAPIVEAFKSHGKPVEIIGCDISEIWYEAGL